jgi:ribosomal-protein-alanine N-acetyltransferase
LLGVDCQIHAWLADLSIRQEQHGKQLLRYCKKSLGLNSPLEGYLKTQRLVLRDFHPDDLEPLYQIQSDTQAMRYTYCATSREASAQRLRAYAALKGQIGFAPWTVVLQSEERVIGWGGLNIDPFDPGWGYEVAYFFHPAYWGKGYATELVQASLVQGFTHHSLDEIVAFAHPQNAASMRILEKCGY